MDITRNRVPELSMFREDGNPISSEAFLAGAAHVDSLKIWGVDYLKAAGFSFRSDDSMVASLLQFSAGNLALGGVKAKSHAKDLSTGGAMVREWLRRAAS